MPLAERSAQRRAAFERYENRCHDVPPLIAGDRGDGDDDELAVARFANVSEYSLPESRGIRGLPAGRDTGSTCRSAGGAVCGTIFANRPTIYASEGTVAATAYSLHVREAECSAGNLPDLALPFTEPQYPISAGPNIDHVPAAAATAADDDTASDPPQHLVE